MTDNEARLIQIIREYEDPVEAMKIAMAVIAYFLKEGGVGNEKKST